MPPSISHLHCTHHNKWPRNLQLREKHIKQIMSHPDKTSDPAVYILDGTASPEFEIHRHALSLFEAIARHPESAESDLARRQLLLSPTNGWWVCVHKMIMLYVQAAQPSRDPWGSEKVYMEIHLKVYWTSRIVRLAVYSKKARFLNPHAYANSKPHPDIRYACR